MPDQVGNQTLVINPFDGADGLLWTPAHLGQKLGVGTINSSVRVANEANASRFVPPVSFQSASIKFLCTVNDAGSPNGDLGVYDQTGARIFSTGSTDFYTAAAGIRTVTASVPFIAGQVYYIALASVGSTAQVQTINVNTAQALQVAGATYGKLLGFSKAAAVPLPDPIGAITSPTNTNIPVFIIAKA